MTKSRELNEIVGKGRFTAQHHQKLSALGYTSIDELAAAAGAAPKEMESFLGFDPRNELHSISGQTKSAYDSLLAEASRAPTPFPLGVLLEKIPSPPPELSQRFMMAAKAAAALPPQVNLIPQCPPIRDQKNRGTCVAFSTLSAYEQKTEDFSEQFVYALCKQRDGHPNAAGTWLGISYPAVRDVGVCFESTWSYNPNPIPGNEGQNPPPAAAMTEAALHKRNFVQLPPKDVLAIKSALAAGQRVSFSIPVFNSWYRNVVVAATGNIIMPVPGESPVGGHAMAFVGYKDDATAPGGGRFFLRNSWGSAWATSSTLGIGYGTLPYQYLALFGMEAYRFA